MSFVSCLLYMLVLFLLAISLGTICKYQSVGTIQDKVKLVFLLPIQTIAVILMLYNELSKEHQKERNKKSAQKKRLFEFVWHLCCIKVLFRLMPSIASRLAYVQIHKSKIKNIVRRIKNDCFDDLKADVKCGYAY